MKRFAFAALVLVSVAVLPNPVGAQGVLGTEGADARDALRRVGGFAPVGKLDLGGDPSQALSARGIVPRYQGSALDVAGNFSLRGGTLRRYSQMIDGIPVEGGGLVLRRDGAGKPLWSSGKMADPSRAWRTSPALSMEQARAVALGTEGLSAEQKTLARLVYLPVGGLLPLAWRIDLPTNLTKLEAPTLWIDAETGAPLFKANRLRFQEAQLARARVYSINPTTSANLIDVELSDLVAPTSGPQMLSGKWISTYNCVDDADFGFTLMGYRTCAPKALAQVNVDGDFLGSDFEPVTGERTEAAKNDHYSEISAYYHANRVHEYFREMFKTWSEAEGSAGEEHSVVNATPLPVVVNFMVASGRRSQLTYFDNAFYYPATNDPDPLFETDSLVFGQGSTVDYAYDGDVVYHEFTHAVVGASSNLAQEFPASSGWVNDPGSMNEAFADYFSAAIRHDPVLGAYSLGNRARDLRAAATCPESIQGEVHADSAIWSSALWSLREREGTSDERRALVDGAVFNTMVGLTETSTFGEASGVLLAEVGELLGADERSWAESLLASRGLPDCGGRIVALVADGTTSPGEQYLLGSDSGYSLGGFAGYVQYRLAGLEGSGALRVEAELARLAMAMPDVMVVMKVGEAPISFGYKSRTGVSGDWESQMTLGGELKLPEGTSVVHLALVNEGGSTIVSNLTVEKVAAAKESVQPDKKEGGGGGGCGAATGGAGGGTALGALLALAALVLASRRRGVLI